MGRRVQDRLTQILGHTLGWHFDAVGQFIVQASNLAVCIASLRLYRRH